MIKDALKTTARKLGVNFTHNDRLGVDLELDIARLTAERPIATIFDVGANYGQTAIHYASAFPAATIFSFEPVPNTFERLQRAVQYEPRIKPFNIGLGESTGVMQMNLADVPNRNSLLAIHSPTGVIDITIKTLDEFASQNKVEAIDLLKIDVEGYEIQVLKGARQLLQENRIRFVYAECVFAPDPDMPHTSFFDLHPVLENAGFCFFTSYVESFVRHSGCAMVNVLYALRAQLPSQVPGHVNNIV